LTGWSEGELEKEIQIKPRKKNVKIKRVRKVRKKQRGMLLAIVVLESASNNCLKLESSRQTFAISIYQRPHITGFRRGDIAVPIALRADACF
jgi:hypothetical protein